ncbi:MAG: hypothetical protein LBP22_08765 [Deltaproteobacteria bacterium]|jgi:hypothetical protein|nr:hypothetical protein [Deltaproteobacteria bacterium]
MDINEKNEYERMLLWFLTSRHTSFEAEAEELGIWSECLYDALMYSDKGFDGSEKRQAAKMTGTNKTLWKSGGKPCNSSRLEKRRMAVYKWWESRQKKERTEWNDLQDLLEAAWEGNRFSR